jgi:hypothetical protein
MTLEARRTFRFASVVALCLALAYGFDMRLAFLAPMLAVLLTAPASPPPPLKGLIALLLVASITTGIGLLLTLLLEHYAFVAIVIIAAGLYLSTIITVGRGKALVGALLTLGVTLIPAAGLIEHVIAAAAIRALLLGIALTVICQWLVYPLFPEDPATGVSATPPAPPVDVPWIALRTTLIVLPPLLVTFSNPALYLPTIMKTVMLGQQGSTMSAREAGRELVGSTLIAGALAIAFWFVLKLWPTLWMMFLWMLLLSLYFGAKLYGVLRTRYTQSFWINAAVTMLIMLGPAVQDSAVGNDVYRGFAVRFSLFVAVTLYAWMAIAALELLRSRRTPMTQPAPAR